MYKILGTEWFSIEYCKMKTKVITLASRKVNKQSSEPIKLQANACSQGKAWENLCEQLRIGFGFTTDSIAERVAQDFYTNKLLLSIGKQNQSKHVLL